jgi:hypothetical protein
MRCHLMVATLIFMISLSPSYAQGLGAEELTEVGHKLSQEASSDEHNNKHSRLANRQLKKLAMVFSDLGEKKISLSRDEGRSKGKVQLLLKNTARSIGKASVWVGTATSRPFMHGAGFLTGFFEKSGKNQEVLSLYRFILSNSEEFDELYLEASTPLEMADLMLLKIDEIFQRKSRKILQDYLRLMGIHVNNSDDSSKLSFSAPDLELILNHNINPNFFNNHHEYQDLKGILGEMSAENLQEIILYDYFDHSIGIEIYASSLPKLHEGLLALAGQLIAPRLVLGVISRVLSGVVGGGLLLADTAMGVSVFICLEEKTQKKFAHDKDLLSFCSYVINRSAYLQIKSRASGFVKGKEARKKLENKINEHRRKRMIRRAQMNPA